MEGSRVGGFGAFGFRAQGAQTLRSPKIPTPKPQNPFLRPPLRPPPPVQDPKAQVLASSPNLLRLLLVGTGGVLRPQDFTGCEKEIFLFRGPGCGCHGDGDFFRATPKVATRRAAVHDKLQILIPKGVELNPQTQTPQHVAVALHALSVKLRVWRYTARRQRNSLETMEDKSF